MKNKVTIIIPNYNHAAYLKQRIESVINQTYPFKEIIILDDCSTDNSDEVINSLIKDKPEITYIRNHTNSGSTFHQWNKGISMATGKYIWLAESDDYADLNFLETLIPMLDNDPKTSIVYSQSLVFSEEGNFKNNVSWTDDLSKELWNNNFRIEGKEAVLKYWTHKNILINASAAVFRKEIYENQVKENLKFKLCGDWYTWVSMMKNSYLQFCSLPLNYYRRHENTVTHQYGRMLMVKKEINQIHLYCAKNVCTTKKDFQYLKEGFYLNWKSYVVYYGKSKYISQFFKSLTFFTFPKFIWPFSYILRLMREKAF